MATLTIAEAAHRLGVKPGKVRRYISAHKLSARSVPSLTGARGHGQVMLDADEVEQLARLRAYKRQTRSSAASDTDEIQATADEVAATAHDEPEPSLTAPHEDSHTAHGVGHDEQRANGAAHDEQGADRAAHDEATLLDGELDSGAVYAIDPTGQRTVALVQSLLAPLVAELHDARETIRRQAEELGGLRATLASLEQRASPTLEGLEERSEPITARHLAQPAALGHHAATAPQRRGNGSTPGVMAEPGQPMPLAASEPGVPTPSAESMHRHDTISESLIRLRAPQTPVWRRVMAHIFGSS